MLGLSKQWVELKTLERQVPYRWVESVVVVAFAFVMVLAVGIVVLAFAIVVVVVAIVVEDVEMSMVNNQIFEGKRRDKCKVAVLVVVNFRDRKVLHQILAKIGKYRKYIKRY